MDRKTRVGAGVLGLAAVSGIALLVPSLASGGARTSVGSGRQEALIATPFVTALSGAAEAPAPGDPDGEGAAAVTIDPVTGEICVDLRVGNIQPAIAAHIHQGPPGVAGPIVVPLPALPAPTSAQCVAAAPALAAQIASNPSGFYVNVHTGDFPNGAIRGQLAPSASTSGITQLLNEPLRAYDSRDTAEGRLAAGSTRVISVANGRNAANVMQVAVPPGSTGALLRITVTDAVGAGFLKVYSNALANPPATSSVNWYETDAIVGSDATVAVDATSRIKISAVINSTHVVVDVVGYVY